MTESNLFLDPYHPDLPVHLRPGLVFLLESLKAERAERQQLQNRLNALNPLSQPDPGWDYASFFDKVQSLYSAVLELVIQVSDEEIYVQESAERIREFLQEVQQRATEAEVSLKILMSASTFSGVVAEITEVD